MGSALKRQNFTVGTALAAAVLLTGCSASGGGGGPAADQSSAPEVPDNNASPSEQQISQDVTRSIEEAVQTITYPMQGYDGEITMGLHPPVVEGQTMLVTISFVPEFDDPSVAEDDEISFSDLHGDNGNSVLMPVVSDRQNLKAYHVPRETENEFVQGGGWIGGSSATGIWASAIGDVTVSSGDHYTHWAYFPAPEDEIDVVDIAVIPGMQEFRDVAIDWETGDAAS